MGLKLHNDVVKCVCVCVYMFALIFSSPEQESLYTKLYNLYTIYINADMVCNDDCRLTTRNHLWFFKARLLRLLLLRVYNHEFALYYYTLFISLWKGCLSMASCIFVCEWKKITTDDISYKKIIEPTNGEYSRGCKMENLNNVEPIWRILSSYEV